MKKRLLKWSLFLLVSLAVANIHAASPLPANPLQKAAAPDKEKEVEKKEAPEVFTVEKIEKQIEELKTAIETAEQAENEKTAAQLGVSLQDLQEHTASLRAIRATYEGFITALKKKSGLEQEEALLQKKLSTDERRGLSQEPPYSLSFYDTLLADLAAVEDRKKAVEQALALTKKTIEDEASKLEKAQKEWRSIKEQFDNQNDTEKSRTLKWSLEKARLAQLLAEGRLHAAKAEQDNLLKEQALLDPRQQLYQSQINWVRGLLSFDEADLQKQLDAKKKERDEINALLEKLTKEQKKVEEAWVKAQEKATTEVKQEERPVAEAYLKEREAWRKTYQTVLEQSERRLKLTGLQEEIWRRRYALVKGDTPLEEIDKWRQELEANLTKLTQEIELEQKYQNNLQSQINAAEQQLAATDLDPRIRKHLQNQIAAFRRAAERQTEYTATLLSTEQLGRRLEDEIGLTVEEVPIEKGLVKLKETVKGLWGYEVWHIDNRPVTVKKIIIALFILIAGMMMAKFVIRFLTRRLFKLVHLEETTVSTFQKSLTFVAYFCVLLFALRIVNIPLAAFAFLGGAVAIGLGFGAQNLINNFISGFIIMAERPITIGDLIEVEGILGKVEEIGARCTRVRTGENIHILVPNSSFLEKNITNWTLSDQQIRTCVTVGVIYGSPIEQVEQLLLKAVQENEQENEQVLDTPAPFVLFRDFGDNALIFEVYFWISIQQIIERRILESSVRFRIDSLFREAGIVIAFPQTDVHLDTQKPLELRLLNPNDRVPPGK